MRSIYLFIFFIAQLACTQKTRSPYEGFVYVQDVIPTISVDLRYFSADNFVGTRVDGYLTNELILSEAATKALANIQNELALQNMGLKIFDGYRPQQAVDHFSRWATDLSDTLTKTKYYPEVDKSILFDEGYISAKSGHSRGSTVDLTLVYLTGENAGQEIDMGTGWDYFGLESWPESDAVTPEQKANRFILRNVMIKNGFNPVTQEWWHFTLKDEPFPTTYFNFAIQ